ncbi:MAG: hypothetical protein ACK4GL_02250 [Flavobacteriales bacterium]
MKPIYLLVAKVLCLNSIWSQADLFDQSNSLLFAKYLFKSEQYESAASELERLSFLSPVDTSYRIMAMECYLYANQPAVMRVRGSLLIPNRTGVWGTLNDRLLVRSFFKETEYDVARNAAKSSAWLPETEKIYFDIYASLFKENYKEAKQSFVPMQIEPEYVPMMNNALAFAQEGTQLKLKSPALAAGMSAIVPGVGKFYTKDWKDGLIGFFTIGAAAYQSVRGFQRRGVNSAYGWIFGGLATGFYIGNIYGSAASAHRYNKKVKKKLKLKIENTFNADYQPLLLQ